MKSTKPITYRNCKDCNTSIVYIPKRIRCITCYKKNMNNAEPNAISLFIPDDD